MRDIIKVEFFPWSTIMEERVKRERESKKTEALKSLLAAVALEISLMTKILSLPDGITGIRHLSSL